MSIYNRLSRPIAVLGRRDAFMHLCRCVGLDPNNNDVFYHVDTYNRACGRTFSRLLEVEGAKDTHDYLTIHSLVSARIRNEARARKSPVDTS